MKFSLITAVWGEWYIESFLKFNVPSLLSPGNIPELCKLGTGRYAIFTRDSDQSRLRSSPAYAALSRHINVDLICYPDHFFNQNAHSAHGKIWRDAVAQAKDRGEWAAFIGADIVWADGAIGHMGRQFRDGKAVLYGFPLRVTEHTFMAETDSLGTRSGDAWTIEPRTLVQTALRNLSPMYLCYFRETEHFGHHPELQIYPVEGEGLVFRDFLTHCLAVDPARFDLTAGLSPATISDPAEVGFLTDSDDYANVSITPIEHQTNWFFLKKKSDPTCTAKLWSRHYLLANRLLAKESFLFHYVDMTKSKWQPVINRANNNFMLTYLSMTFSFALNALARQHDTTLAQNLIAWALVEKKLHKWCASRKEISVLIPVNEALEGSLMDRLLAAPREQLGAVLRQHCLVGSLAAAAQAGGTTTLDGEAVTVSATRIGFKVNGRRARLASVDNINRPGLQLYIYDTFAGRLP